MKKKYYLAIANLALIVPFILFVRIRFYSIQQYYFELGKEFDLESIFKTMKHDIIILTSAALSLVGVLFLSKKKIFFFISSFYLATQIVTLFLIPNLSITYLIMIPSAMVFVWLLVWNNAFSVYENKWMLKLTFLLAGMLVYIALLYYFKIL